MQIKTGDKVKILSGKDKGKSGKVLQVFVKENKVVVEGLNLMIKHQRAKSQGQKGQRIQFPSPINASSVILICPKCGQITRVGKKIIKAEAAEGKKAKTIKNRACHKCQETI